MANKSAKKALEQMKMQAASEVGVNLNNGGYNGDLTARQAGSIGGQMVKKIVESQENQAKGSNYVKEILIQLEFFVGLSQMQI